MESEMRLMMGKFWDVFDLDRDGMFNDTEMKLYMTYQVEVLLDKRNSSALFIQEKIEEYMKKNGGTTREDYLNTMMKDFNKNDDKSLLYKLGNERIQEYIDRASEWVRILVENSLKK